MINTDFAQETMMVLAELVKEGKFDHIGLSEIAADTLRRAHTVTPLARQTYRQLTIA